MFQKPCSMLYMNYLMYFSQRPLSGTYKYSHLTDVLSEAQRGHNSSNVIMSEW